MNKLIATFFINEGQLRDAEGVYQGCPEDEADLLSCLQTAFGWAEGSGIYLDDYKALPEDSTTGLTELLDRVRAEAIDKFAEKLHELCGMELGGFQYPDVLHEEMIDEIAEELKKSYDKAIDEDMER